MCIFIKNIMEVLDGLPISKYGIGDISGLHPLADSYPKAISLLLGYSPQFNFYDESKFHNLLITKKAELDKGVKILKKFLDSQRIEYLIIPHADQDPKTLIGMFSHKLAATRAGLGWIGKNSLLITEEYGPRVRLSTILINYDLPFNRPIISSKCDNCRICVDACPYHFIKNEEWYPSINRELLVSVFACSSKREESIKTIGRKHSCGLCLLACPIGTKKDYVR